MQQHDQDVSESDLTPGHRNTRQTEQKANAKPQRVSVDNKRTGLEPTIPDTEQLELPTTTSNRHTNSTPTPLGRKRSQRRLFQQLTAEHKMKK